MHLEQLIADTESTDVRGNTSVEVTGVACDSRRVRSGYLFVAIPGVREDGSRYIEDALSRGAAAVVSERLIQIPGSVPLVVVPDARAALSACAAALHGRPSEALRMIGITGTNGKTTCVYLVRAILEAASIPTGVIGTVSYDIGERTIPASRTTPDPAVLQDLLHQMQSAGCDAVAMEVSSHALVQQRVRDVAFDVVAFTNLTQDHLDYHGDMQAYFEAKLRLFLQASSGSKKTIGVVNLDDPWGVRLLEREDVAIECVTYGEADAAQVRAASVDLRDDGLAFDLVTPWGSRRVSSTLMGRFNISNILAAAAITGVMGVPVQTLAAVVRDCDPVPGRLEPVPARGGRRVFVDYAHTDDALANVVGTLREITRGKLIVVFGCGGDRDRRKRPLMGGAASREADHVVVTSDNPRSEDARQIIDEILPGITPGVPCDVVPDRREAIRHALKLAGRRDVVLVAGKGHEAFQELANRTIPFDDRRVVAEELRAL